MNATPAPAPAVAIDLDLLADRIALTAASLDAATHTLLTDLREFDSREGWAAQGMKSCPEWLSWKCGIALGAAREKVRVAQALASLPLMDDELRRGQLSFSKVRAMTRVATADNEAKLVELARHSTAAQLEKICRLVDQLRPRSHAVDEERRWLRSRDMDNGMVRIEAQLRHEEAARVLAACDVFAASAAERADALLTMAEAALRGDKPERPPVEILVHIDADTLTGDMAGTGISAEISRRLLCDAGIRPVSGDDVGRKSRVFAGALRRALFARAGGCCQFPGCTHTRYLHGHHLRHWVDGGETSLANACVLCARHHTLVHEGGFRVTVGQHGSLVFLGPEGRPITHGAAPHPCPLPAPQRLPRVWDGARVDFDAAVACVT
jgi:uncharacterized protein DUF222